MPEQSDDLVAVLDAARARVGSGPTPDLAATGPRAEQLQGGCLGRLPAPAPPPVGGQVDHDAAHIPRGQSMVDPPPREIGAQQGLVQEVFAGDPAAGQQRGGPAEPGIRAGDEVLEILVDAPLTGHTVITHQGRQRLSGRSQVFERLAPRQPGEGRVGVDPGSHPVRFGLGILT